MYVSLCKFCALNQMRCCVCVCVFNVHVCACVYLYIFVALGDFLHFNRTFAIYCFILLRIPFTETTHILAQIKWTHNNVPREQKKSMVAHRRHAQTILLSSCSYTNPNTHKHTRIVFICCVAVIYTARRKKFSGMIAIGCEASNHESFINVFCLAVCLFACYLFVFEMLWM